MIDRNSTDRSFPSILSCLLTGSNLFTGCRPGDLSAVPGSHRGQFVNALGSLRLEKTFLRKVFQIAGASAELEQEWDAVFGVQTGPWLWAYEQQRSPG